MTKAIDILITLDTKGMLNQLYKLGLVSTKILFYHEIYLYYDGLLKTGKAKNKEQAKILSEEKFKVGYRTICKAIRLMQQEA